MRGKWIDQSDGRRLEWALVRHRYCVNQSPSKVDDVKVGRHGHQQVGLVLNRDACRCGRSGVIAGIRVRRAGSYRRTVYQSRTVGHSSAQRGLNRDSDSITISKSCQVKARPHAGDRAGALRRGAGGERYAGGCGVGKDHVLGIIWSRVGQLDGVGKRTAGQNLRGRRLAGQSQIRRRRSEFEGSNVTVRALRTCNSPLICCQDMVIIAGIDRGAVCRQRQGRRTCVAVLVDRQRRQMRIGCDCDARAIVVGQDQIAAAIRINSADIPAVDRIRSALQYALIGAVSRDDRVEEFERSTHRDTSAQWVCNDHDTTAGAGSKVVADGRAVKSERAVQREDGGPGIPAIARFVRGINDVDAALAPVHIVVGERAVADHNCAALIEDGTSQSSTPTATATAVASSSETARESGFAVLINLGAYAEACTASKAAISSMTATDERPEVS